MSNLVACVLDHNFLMEHFESIWSMQTMTMNVFFSSCFWYYLLLHVQTSLLLKLWTADVVHLSYFLTSMFHQFIRNSFAHGLCLCETMFWMALTLLLLVSTNACQISSEFLSLRVKVFPRMGLVRWMRRVLTSPYCSCVSLPDRCELRAGLFSTKIIFGRFPLLPWGRAN